MRNKFTHLNDHLFAQLERITDENLSPEKLAVEIQRAQAVAGIARQIVGNANIVFKAKRLQLEYGPAGEKTLPGFFSETPALALVSKDSDGKS